MVALTGKVFIARLVGIESPVIFKVLPVPVESGKDGAGPEKPVFLSVGKPWYRNYLRILS
jgi:hypothetical protein